VAADNAIGDQAADSGRLALAAFDLVQRVLAHRQPRLVASYHSVTRA